MVDIQPATAEIRRGKRRKIEEEETTGQKYNGLPITVGGHKKLKLMVVFLCQYTYRYRYIMGMVEVGTS